jgi:hypothetical protein
MRVFTVLAIAFISSFQLVAQIQTGSVPHSLRTNMQMFDRDLRAEELPAPNIGAIIAEDIERDEMGKVPFDGRFIHTSLNLNNSGTWYKLDNGASLWKLKVTSADALGLEMYYDDFFMPPGAELHIYSEDGEQYYGAYTEFNNHETKLFVTEIIKGETTILEYYEPDNVAGQGRISIDRVAYIYRDVSDNGRGGDDCQVHVNCPEGNPWQDQKRGVVRIRMSGTTGGTFWCSGSLINNTAQDCKPYVLSAYHCADDPTITSASYATFRFFFNYERPTCVFASGECTCSGVVPTNQTVVGCTLAARSQNSGGTNSSDFIMFELTDAIPASYNAYWNGWNLQSTNFSGGGASIHHPSFSPKKISFSTNSITSTNVWSNGSALTHWRIVWTGTQSGHGVTEGGSSGSPLFDNNKLIIGTLSGGSSFCNSVVPNGQNAPDYYGKISWSWNQNTGAQVMHLQSKLDPLNTGQTVLQGSFAPCAVSIDEHQISNSISIYPNPTSGLFSVDLGEYSSKFNSLVVYNIVGAQVAQKAINTDLVQIDLSAMPRGLYLVVMELEDQKRITKKISVY